VLKADFRERIMLAVTQVNGCGLCAWAHTREALRAGIDRAEIQQMLAAEFDGVPEAQRTALLFAQHWADTQGQPDAAAQAAFEAAYPPAERANIVFAIRTINTMNHMMLGLEGMLRAVGLARRRKG
jgi:AhpD family alkylhydroperoxidase